MEAEKRKRLDAIKDEVKEFHPILAKLFPKLPRVKTVEHTHGSNEMGADFVVFRVDDTFNQPEFIGVIAKIGKIDQSSVSSVSDVDRQIEECFLKEKLIHTGKQEVQLTEVWVVTTGYVSHNAKEKINKKYAGRKITFIPGEELAGLLDTYVPNFWTDVSLEIGEYLNGLRAHNQEIDQSISLLGFHPEKAFYIQQDLYTVPDNQYESDSRHRRKRSKVDVHEVLQRDQVILVEGGMGAGKSKFLRELVGHYTNPEIFLETGCVPIIISYSTVVDKYGAEVQGILADYVPNEAVGELTDKNTYLLLIDGVDEKNLDAEGQLRTLQKLVDDIKRHKNVKAVITTRYLGSLEQNKQLLSVVTRLELPPISTSRVFEFIERLCKEINISKRVYEDLKRSPLFRELPKSPIAAILLASLLNENSKEIPSSVPELYSKYLELVLGRWDIEKGLRSQKEYEALDSIMMQMAEFVIDNELQFISIDDAKRVFSEYLSPRHLGLDPSLLFETMADRTGIVMVDLAENRLCFKHRTFAEFLYAKQKSRVQGLKIDNRAFNPYWMNTFYFYVGLIKDCPDHLLEITNLKPSSDGETLLKIINMPNYYMAGFKSPYDAIQRGVTETIVEAAKYYVDIVERKRESQLALFPKMQLLWLLQMFIRDSYGYEFFMKAAEGAALEIGAMNLDDTIKAYALFFLNVAYIDMGGKASFDFILKDYSNILPIPVQLGIRHESEDLKEKSALLRKQNRALSHALHDNPRLKAQIDSLYHRPIKTLKIT